MDNVHINNAKQNIYKLLESSRLNEAFDAITTLIEDTSTAGLKDEVDQLRISYKLMLQYMSRGILDPQRDTILRHIVNSLYSIADRCVIADQENTSPAVFYARRRELKTQPFSNIIDEWKTSFNKHAMLLSVPEEQQNRAAITQMAQECEQKETLMFNKIWSTFPTTSDDAQAINTILGDDTTPCHAKGLFLSALFLGLTTLYDETKLAILAQAYSTCDEPEVQIRALIYTILTIYIYDKRVSRSDIVRSRLEAMTNRPTFAQDMATIQLLLARSRNTDNVMRKVREDLMPGIMSMSPDLMKKIKDKNTPLDISELEENPEWQDMLENSGISKKFEEFSEMQLEGNDVFISTFSHLKSFPFFRTLSNWFLPYHPNHSLIDTVFGNRLRAVGQTIAGAPLCNSDKYSFCLSMGTIHESQRDMMLSHVQEQTRELDEMASSELPDAKKVRERIANEHLQDLYRFFTLFSRRREFVAIFDRDMDFTSLPFLEDYTRNTSTISIIAEFYFKNGFYDDAIKYFTHERNYSESINPIVFQKIGFCYQNTGNMREALHHYRNYLLAHDNDVWTLKHMAACYRSLQRHDKALECYKKVDQLQPNSVATTLSIGNILLESGQANEALQHYYKADFLAGAKHRAWRPIAWCSFLAGNDERALSYYEKIINEDTATAQDYLNRGHVLLCCNRIPEAIDSYRNSLKLEDGIDSFRKAYFNDAEHLIARGVTSDDMALLVDALTQI